MGHHLLRRTVAPLSGWLAGVAWQLQQPALWTTAQYAVAVGLGVFAWWAGRRCERWRTTLCAGAAVAGIAFGATGLHAASRLADALAPADEGVDVVLVGTVASLPEQGESGTRFTVDVAQAATPAGTPVAVPTSIALGWYRGLHDDAAAVQPGRAIVVGERWRWTVRMRRPAGTQNPNGRDHELSLFEDGVRATGVVRDHPAPVRLGSTWQHPVERLRQHVRDAVVRSVPDHRAAGVLAALAVGDQSAIDRDDWELFRSAGIAHVVSISGVHITMFAWLAGLAIAAGWRRSERAALWCPAQTAARIGGVLAAAAYALIAGWGVPSRRTVWMLAIVAGLRVSGLRWPWPLVLLAAAVAVTAGDPWALLQPGFWLSFTAVGLLMASEPVTQWEAAQDPHRAVRAADDAADAVPTTLPIWQRAGGLLAGHLRAEWRAQAIATVGLAPLTLVFFQQLSVVGFAANVVAIPLVTLLITPLALLGIVCAPLWCAGAWAVQALCSWLGWLVAWPAAVWQVPTAPLWAQLAGLAAAAIGMLPLPWRLRLLALPLAAPLCWPSVARPAVGHFVLIAADVGQGGAVIVRTHAHVLLYDAGPAYGPQADAGERVLVPLLRSLGMSHVDRMVLSHRDLDHVGGARSVWRGVQVGDLLSSLEASHPLLAIAPHPQHCIAGQRWEWDGVHFAVLQPEAGAYADDDAAAAAAMTASASASAIGSASTPTANGTSTANTSPTASPTATASASATAPPPHGRHRSNAVSCVVRVDSPDSGSALLPGDIEHAQEAALVAGDRAALRSDILLVPHHGSRTSSTAAFIDAVAPRHAVVQSGYRNRFGHPAPDVVARYRSRGIDLVTSPDCGAWLWRDGVATCWRVAERRYWQRRDGAADADPVR